MPRLESTITDFTRQRGIWTKMENIVSCAFKGKIYKQIRIKSIQCTINEVRNISVIGQDVYRRNSWRGWGIMRRLHGVWSLVLIFVSIVIGAVSIAHSSRIAALTYIMLCSVSFIIIVYAFCSKCPCRQNCCGHVLPGQVTKLLPERSEGPYRTGDYIGVLLPLLFIIGFPQFWLIGSLGLMVIFWVLIIVSVIEITFKVCKGCGNSACPMNSKLN